MFFMEFQNFCQGMSKGLSWNVQTFVNECQNICQGMLDIVKECPCILCQEMSELVKDCPNICQGMSMHTLSRNVRTCQGLSKHLSRNIHTFARFFLTFVKNSTNGIIYYDIQVLVKKSKLVLKISN